jgi:predicted secreted acid phosphatase
MNTFREFRFWRQLHLLVIASLLLGACTTLPVKEVPHGIYLSDNLTEIKDDLVSYHDNGLYEKQLAAVDQAATDYVVSRADKVKMPALVLDIDETSLSNWPQIKANDFAYFADPQLPCDKLPLGPCGAYQWDKLTQAKAIEPTLALFRVAKAHGVAVFFITGRHNYPTEVDETELTKATLVKAGFSDWDGVALRSSEYAKSSVASYKSAERKKIVDHGYTILANVGDQPSDLAGGYAERTFLLPNPFYRIN